MHLRAAQLHPPPPQTFPPTTRPPHKLPAPSRPLLPLPPQASHNMRIKREAKAEAAHGHILALPFSDRYLEAVNDAVLNTGEGERHADTVRGWRPGAGCLGHHGIGCRQGLFELCGRLEAAWAYRGGLWHAQLRKRACPRCHPPILPHPSRLPSALGNLGPPFPCIHPFTQTGVTLRHLPHRRRPRQVLHRRVRGAAGRQLRVLHMDIRGGHSRVDGHVAREARGWPGRSPKHTGVGGPLGVRGR